MPQRKRSIADLERVTDVRKSQRLIQKRMRASKLDIQDLLCAKNVLPPILRYLGVQDLVRAGSVCSTWQEVVDSNHHLWRSVWMTNSPIQNVKGLANTMKQHGTINGDFRNMSFSSDTNEMWREFSREIHQVDSLRKIELGLCCPIVVEQLALSNPKLEVIKAHVKCEHMRLANLSSLKNLRELSLTFKIDSSMTELNALTELKHLEHLSLKGIKNLNDLNVDVIAELTNLTSLELGDCTQLPERFGQIIKQLPLLNKLRLEKGRNSHTLKILEAIKDMPHIRQLELINFDIVPGFDAALGACLNIKKLLIIPIYGATCATTNAILLRGLLELSITLSHFIWGVTTQVVTMTNNYLQKNSVQPVGYVDCIPVLNDETRRVHIMDLFNFRRLLSRHLPNTKLRIIKLPLCETSEQAFEID